MVYKVGDKFFTDERVAEVCSKLENKPVEKVDFKTIDNEFVKRYSLLFQTKQGNLITVNSDKFSTLFIHLYSTCLTDYEKKLFNNIYSKTADKNKEYIKLSLQEIVDNINSENYVLDKYEYSDERDLVIEIFATLFSDRFFIGVEWCLDEQTHGFTYLMPKDCSNEFKISILDHIDYNYTDVNIEAISSIGNYLLDAYCEEIFGVDSVINELREI